MTVLSALGWGLAGGLAGLVYFHGVWASAQALTRGGRSLRIAAMTAARFLLLGALLALAARTGAPELLATTLGLLLARGAIMRRIGRITP